MSLSFQERDLAKLGIDASVESAGPGWLEITLTSDDFDRLVDGSLYADDISDDLNEAESIGYDKGWEAGYEEGTEAALSDLRNQTGAAWEVVSEEFAVERAEGYAQALKDLMSLRDAR